MGRNHDVPAPALVTLGLLGVTVGLFLPWVRSGSAWRSSFGAVWSAEALGGLDGAASRLIGTAWVFLPLLAAVALLAGVSGRRTALGWAAMITSALALVGSGFALLSPYPTGAGPVLTAAAAVLASVGGVGCLRPSIPSEVPLPLVEEVR